MIERIRITDASTISGQTRARRRCLSLALPDDPGAGFPERSGAGLRAGSGCGEVSAWSGTGGRLGGHTTAKPSAVTPRRSSSGIAEPAAAPLLAHHRRGLDEVAEAVADVLTRIEFGRPTTEDRLLFRPRKTPPGKRPLVMLCGAGVAPILVPVDAGGDA